MHLDPVQVLLLGGYNKYLPTRPAAKPEDAEEEELKLIIKQIDGRTSSPLNCLELREPPVAGRIYWHTQEPEPEPECARSSR